MEDYRFDRVILVMMFFIIILVPLPGQDGISLVTQWGEFGDKPGQLKFPAMLASDKNSDIYVVDQHNHRIQKFDANGKFILMWGKPGSGPGEFQYPYGIAIDSKGNVYVSDVNNNRIQKFSKEGVFLAETGKYGTGDGHFKYPYGIAMDNKDVLYVIDAFNYRIQKFSSDLKFLSKWGNQEIIGFKLYMPHDIAISKNGSVILSDRQNHRVSFFTENGVLINRFGEFGEGKRAEGNQFSEPHGIAVNNIGEIFICDRYNFQIHKNNSEGAFITRWYTSGNLDNSKHFPLGITVLNNDYVIVTDHYAHCVQKYKTIGF